jgi:hypothetical protein
MCERGLLSNGLDEKLGFRAARAQKLGKLVTGFEGMDSATASCPAGAHNLEVGDISL